MRETGMVLRGLEIDRKPLKEHKFHNEFEEIRPFIDGNVRTGRLLVNLELMKAGYPPIDIKLADRISYYNAFDEYHVNHDSGAMEKLCSRPISEFK